MSRSKREVPGRRLEGRGAPTLSQPLGLLERQLLAFLEAPDCRVVTLRVHGDGFDRLPWMLGALQAGGAIDVAAVVADATTDRDTPFATMVSALETALARSSRRDAKAPAFDETLPHAVAAVAFVEQSAEYLRHIVPRLVIVVSIDDRAHPDVRAALKVFVLLLRSASVRLIVLDGSTTPVVRVGTPALRRTEVVDFRSPPEERRCALRCAVCAYHASVVIAAHGEPEPSSVLKEIVVGPVIQWSLPCTRRAVFEAELARAAESLALAARAPIARPSAAPSLEWAVGTLEELRVATAPDAQLVVVLDPGPVRQPKQLAATLEALAAMPLRPWLRFVIVDAKGDIAAAITHHRLEARLLELDG